MTAFEKNKEKLDLIEKISQIEITADLVLNLVKMVCQLERENNALGEIIVRKAQHTPRTYSRYHNVKLEDWR